MDEKSAKKKYDMSDVPNDVHSKGVQASHIWIDKKNRDLKNKRGENKNG